MAAATLPRLVIESVEPVVDGGRHPVKRVRGDVVQVGADIYKDGHDMVAARVLCRPVGEPEWREQRLEYDFDPDRWSGSFRVDQVGRWEFLIEAWPDHVRTWQDGLKKRLGNPKFVEKAPAEVVAQVKEQVAELEQRLGRLEEAKGLLAEL